MIAAVNWNKSQKPWLKFCQETLYLQLAKQFSWNLSQSQKRYVPWQSFTFPSAYLLSTIFLVQPLSSNLDDKFTALEVVYNLKYRQELNISRLFIFRMPTTTVTVGFVTKRAKSSVARRVPEFSTSNASNWKRLQPRIGSVRNVSLYSPQRTWAQGGSSLLLFRRISRCQWFSTSLFDVPLRTFLLVCRTAWHLKSI